MCGLADIQLCLGSGWVGDTARSFPDSPRQKSMAPDCAAGGPKL
jgi:hypothetical protein